MAAFIHPELGATGRADGWPAESRQMLLLHQRMADPLQVGNLLDAGYRETLNCRRSVPRRRANYAAAEARVNKGFQRLSHWAADVVGSPAAFLAGAIVIALWAISGPAFHFSDTWQLVINTGTTIVTFLMVFLIQNTQNRDSRALHLKLDELIRSVKTARDQMVGLETLPDEELDALEREFMQLRDQAEERLHSIEARRHQRSQPLDLARRS